SIERTPARTAFLIPGAPCAWDITCAPWAAASATMTPISASVNWEWRGSSRGEGTPPVAQILVWSAPGRRSSRGFRWAPSGTAGVRGQERRFGSGDQVEVPVSAGLGHDVDGDRQPRAAHGAGLDGDLRAEVGSSGIADRGHPALERGFHMGHGIVELKGERVV